MICYDRRSDYLFGWQPAWSTQNNPRTKAPLRFMLNWPDYLSGYCYL